MPDKVHLCGRCRMNQKVHGKAGTSFWVFFLGVQGSNSMGSRVLAFFFLVFCGARAPASQQIKSTLSVQ